MHLFNYPLSSSWNIYLCPHQTLLLLFHTWAWSPLTLWIPLPFNLLHHCYFRCKVPRHTNSSPCHPCPCLYFGSLAEQSPLPYFFFWHSPAIKSTLTFHGPSAILSSYWFIPASCPLSCVSCALCVPEILLHHMAKTCLLQLSFSPTIFFVGRAMTYLYLGIPAPSHCFLQNRDSINNWQMDMTVLFGESVGWDALK